MISSTRIAAVVVISVFLSGLVGGDPNRSVVKQVCKLRHYQDFGEYHNCVSGVFNELITMTAKHGYNYLADGRSGRELSGICYGQAACNGKLSPSDCSWCLIYALSKMQDYCKTSVGALMKLEDCRIRYEEYLFDPDY